MTNEIANMKVNALDCIIAQYDFLKTLEECGDSTSNPQYYTQQVENLRGMREMFDVIFGDAPYTYAALDMQAALA